MTTEHRLPCESPVCEHVQIAGSNHPEDVEIAGSNHPEDVEIAGSNHPEDVEIAGSYPEDVEIAGCNHPEDVEIAGSNHPEYVDNPVNNHPEDVNNCSDNGTSENDSRGHGAREVHIKVMIAVLTLLNPVCFPVLWYTFRAYKKRLKDGCRSSYTYYIKLAIVVFSIGVLITVSTIAIIYVICVLNIRTESRVVNSVNISTTNIHVESMSSKLPLNLSAVTSTNFTELLEKRHMNKGKTKQGARPPQFSGLNTAGDEAVILFKNSTFIRYSSKRRGIIELKVPRNLGMNLKVLQNVRKVS